MLTSSKSKVTLSDIAKKLNVTVSTVSRAINDPEKISSETRAKVMELVKELNYTPNSAARTLKTNKTGTLGYLYNRDKPFSEQTTPIRIFEALEIESQSRGYHMALASIPNNGPEIKLPVMVEEQRVDGLFLGGQMDSDLILKLQERNIPLVLLGNYARDVDVSCIIQDDIGGAYKIIKHFLDNGHKRIGFIGAPMDNLWSWERLQGMRLALEECGITFDNELIHSEDLWSGRDAFLKLMGLSNPPTAIFCACDRLARNVIEVANEQGIKIPEKLSIAGFDDEPWAAMANPPLTTVNIFPQKMAIAAIEKMMGIIDEKTIVSRTVTPAELIVRDSSGPVPA